MLISRRLPFRLLPFLDKMAKRLFGNKALLDGTCAQTDRLMQVDVFTCVTEGVALDDETKIPLHYTSTACQ